MTRGRGERRGAGGAAALLGGERPTSERGTGERPSVDQLWLETLGQIAARAAHEIKGALNGVSVNLEVVRTRATKPDAPATAVHRYAESAADQLEALTRMSEALLYLARPQRRPVDVVLLLRKLLALLAPATAAEGGRLELGEVPELPVIGHTTTCTDAPYHATRLALAAALLAAIEHKGHVGVAVSADEAVRVTLDCSAGEAIELPPALVDAVAERGIAVSANGRRLSLAFPRAAREMSTPDRA